MWPFVTGFFHLAWCSQGPSCCSMSQYCAPFFFFFAEYDPIIWVGIGAFLGGLLATSVIRAPTALTVGFSLIGRSFQPRTHQTPSLASGQWNHCLLHLQVCSDLPPDPSLLLVQATGTKFTPQRKPSLTAPDCSCPRI